jgi:uncharacterized protein
MFELSSTSWLLALFAAFIIGFSKTGIGGLGIFAIIIMANVFPAKESTGIVLPILISADIFAISFYKKHADWRILFRLMPSVVPGIVAGYFFMGHISSAGLKPLIGAIVLFMLCANLILKLKETVVARTSLVFALPTGLMAGFTTMIANAAGPVMAAYLLTMKLYKKAFIGTGAWFFFMMNLFKVPFSASLGLITLPSLKFNLMLFPAAAGGALAGFYLVKYIPQKWFETAIYGVTTAGALRLIFF